MKIDLDMLGHDLKSLRCDSLHPKGAKSPDHSLVGILNAARAQATMVEVRWNLITGCNIVSQKARISLE